MFGEEETLFSALLCPAISSLMVQDFAVRAVLKLPHFEI
jgi:hypothetical protein